MRLSTAIEMADRMRPNTVARPDKVLTLYKLEAQIYEMMGEELPEWDLENDDPELIVPNQYARLYPLYLLPFIDFEQEETELYEIDMITANMELSEFKGWYRRNNPSSETDNTFYQFKGVWI